jgi:hypothetical protein
MGQPVAKVQTCKKCGAPLDLVRPTGIILPCPECKVSLEIHPSLEGSLLINAAGASTSSVLPRPSGLHISQLDLFFHWERVEKSVAESLGNPILGQCALCKGNICLEKGNEVLVECGYCGGHTPVKAEALMLWKKDEPPTFPSSILSFAKKIARPLDSDDRMRAILKYLHLYRWLLIALFAIILGLAMFALRGVLWPG